jgi:hypothetical protein
MARIKALHKRDIIRQGAFTSAEDEMLTAAAEKVMLTRSSFIRWAVLKQIRETLGTRAVPQRERVMRDVTESVEAWGSPQSNKLEREAMGWRTEWWETKRRRSNAQSYISVRHDASCTHLERLLNAHGGEDGGRAVRKHPWAIDRRAVSYGDRTLWREKDLFGATAPSHEALIYAEMTPLVIFDLVVADRSGTIKSAIECVVSHPCTAKKRAFLARIDFPVWSVDASDALALREDNVWLPYLFAGRTNVGHPYTLINTHVRERNREFAKLIAPPVKLPQG